MVLDRVDGDPQAPCDLLVGEPPPHELEDFELPWRQDPAPRRRRGRLLLSVRELREPRHQPAGDPARVPRLAPGDAVDPVDELLHRGVVGDAPRSAGFGEPEDLAVARYVEDQDRELGGQGAQGAGQLEGSRVRDPAVDEGDVPGGAVAPLQGRPGIRGPQDRAEAVELGEAPADARAVEGMRVDQEDVQRVGHPLPPCDFVGIPLSDHAPSAVVRRHAGREGPPLRNAGRDRCSSPHASSL